ncbi:metal-sulfur cluster assembly factor [Streptosporangium sp. H16]|uniref:metal-sulfur cluster assembly factor n=1 Tax=Streptosporangium sp. H16 TaxID=3444184 RepID=UPI003F790ED9
MSKAVETPTTAYDGDTTHDEVMEALKDVVDPELGINVVDLGLIYGLHLDAAEQGTEGGEGTAGGEGTQGAALPVATIDMTLTSAACPLTDVIEDQAHSALEGMVSDVKINWVWLPPWGPDKITDEGREQLRMLGFNV